MLRLHVIRLGEEQCDGEGEICRRWRGRRCGGLEVAAAAAQGRRRLGDNSVAKKDWRRGTAAVTTGMSSWLGQGLAAVAAAATAVGLLPRPFVSSHSRWRRLLSFLKWLLGFVGVPSPLIQPKMGWEGKRPDGTRPRGRRFHMVSCQK